jgi:hypothetical protein
MTNLAKQLYQADQRLFFDLDALNLVRFEFGGQDATAYLKFKDGGSETIHGDAAMNLHQRLSGITATDELKPSSEDTDAQGSPSRSLNNVTVPPMGRNKVWYFKKDNSGKDLIMAFVNAKGSCSVRPFDANTGFALGKRYVSGYYQHQFADLIEGAVELTVDTQPSLERDCKQRLPERTFAHLRKQIEEIA